MSEKQFICCSVQIFKILFRRFYSPESVPALSRVVRTAVPIPAVAAASVTHSAAVGGFVRRSVMWGPYRHLGSFTAANWVSFDFNVSYSSC